GVRESMDDALSQRVRPTLDVVGGFVQTAASDSWRATEHLRPLVKLYVGRLGLEQAWGMFSNPPRGAEYLRCRYYLRQGGGEPTAATELVFPAAPDTEAHLLRAFWDGHQDKAVSNALVAYFRARMRVKPKQQSPGDLQDQRLDPVPANNLTPVVDFFTDRF